MGLVMTVMERDKTQALLLHSWSFVTSDTFAQLASNGKQIMAPCHPCYCGVLQQLSQSEPPREVPSPNIRPLPCNTRLFPTEPAMHGVSLYADSA